MPKDLQGLPIAVAGASSGIGRATALACADAGMPVALGARRLDRVQAIAQEIRDAGGTAWATSLDVTQEESCNAFVDGARAEFGSLHAVYANAGYGTERAVLDMSLEEARAMFETNFFGTLSIVRAAIPGFVQQKSGHILICSSCLGLRPVPHYSMYCATKAAQHHLGQALGVELHASGVDVSTVHPIGTRTEFFDKAHERSGGLKLTGSKDSFRQPSELVASRIVRCLKRPRPEVWTSVGARIIMPVSLCLPRLSARVLRGMMKRRQQNAHSAASSTTA